MKCSDLKSCCRLAAADTSVNPGKASFRCDWRPHSPSCHTWSCKNIGVPVPGRLSFAAVRKSGSTDLDPISTQLHQLVRDNRSSSAQLRLGPWLFVRDPFERFISGYAGACKALLAVCAYVHA